MIRKRHSVFCLLVCTLFLIISDKITVTHGKIQDWERTCVVGECVRADDPFRACLAQPQQLRLGHPTRSDLRSEPIFKNRQVTLSVESCSGAQTSGTHGHHASRGGGDYMPLCCPERKTEEGMLVAGLGAGDNEFPHQVRILIKTSNGVREKCGGTIYNRDYVLTAASCLVFNGEVIRPAAVEVITGQNMEHQRVSKNIHGVRDIKIHEGYTGALHSYGRDNDIALLRLNSPLDLSSHHHHHQSSGLRALRIPEKGFRADGRRAIILGWGRTALEEKPIGALLKMNTNINTPEECSRKARVALKNGKDLSRTSLKAESPHDEHGDPETFEVTKTTFSSKSRNRGNSGSRHSLFDNDDFFNWGRGRSSLGEWEKTQEFVNMGALKLGKLWEGGIEYRKRRTSHVEPPSHFPSSLLCVGGGDDSSGYSRGDSGGPAICEGADGTPVLCGISSYGRNEFRGEWPATYVNVAHYVDWIHSHTGRARQPDDTLVNEVIDGEPISSPDEAPFFVRIRNKKTNKTCGGALINSKTVISSVSCVPLDVRTDDLVVTSGEFSVDQRGTDHEVDGVATRETYKNYQARSQNRRRGEASNTPAATLKGDFPQLNLAVLKLYRPLRQIKPIDLIKPRMERMIVYEYGWRTDGRDKTINKWAYREVHLDECRAKFGAAGIQVDEHHLCATEMYSGGERCNKELGNPLVCEDQHKRKYLCGVTSIRDCSFAFPTVFTNVVENLDWIQL